MNSLAWIPLLLAVPPSTAGTTNHALFQPRPTQDVAPEEAKDQDAPPEQAEEQVVAVVGEIRITEEDLRKEVNRLIPATFFHSRVPADRVAEFERQAVMNLVERALILQDARARGMSATEAELRAEFTDTLAKSGPQFEGVSPERFDELLAQYRPLVERRVLLNKNEARFEKSILPVTEEFLLQSYEERRESLLSPEEAHFLHILIRLEPAASSAEAKAAFEQAGELRAKLDEDADFGEFAREFSGDVFAQAGGDMGFVERGSFMDGGIDTAAFGLEDGETSDVLTSIHGYHIVRRVESRPRRPLTLEECREELMVTLMDERRVEERVRWLGELRERLGVEVLERT